MPHAPGLSPFIFLRQGASIPGWPPTRFVSVERCELLNLLPLPPKCWRATKCAPVARVSVCLSVFLVLTSGHTSVAQMGLEFFKEPTLASHGGYAPDSDSYVLGFQV